MGRNFSLGECSLGFPLLFLASWRVALKLGGTTTLLQLRTMGARSQGEPGLLTAPQGCSSRLGPPLPITMPNDTITPCLFRAPADGFVACIGEGLQIPSAGERSPKQWEAQKAWNTILPGSLAAMVLDTHHAPV